MTLKERILEKNLQLAKNITEEEKLEIRQEMNDLLNALEEQYSTSESATIKLNKKYNGLV